MWKFRFTTRTYIVVLGILFLMSFLFTPTPTPTKSRIPHHHCCHPVVVKSSAASQDAPPGDVKIEFRQNIKNILVWSGNTPFQLVQPGEKFFVIDGCVDTNCFVTSNKNYLPDLRQFDAVVFGADVMKTKQSLPEVRSQNQKYIFTSLNPASVLPISDPVYDNFFNWTWTYRLNSDILWRFFTMIQFDVDILGPVIDMKWPKNLGPVQESLLPVLKGKTKAAAWFPSQCLTNSHRENFVRNLTAELNVYGLHVDIYGKCGQLHCDLTSVECLWKLKKLYYFYLSFEKFIDEDYVTREILIPLQTAMLPVVYGGANYSRFLPPNSFLNARELGPKKLAEVMNEMIKNSSLYLDYFKWTRNFSYEYNEPELCSFCAALNNNNMVNKVSAYEDFRRWWKGNAVPNDTIFPLQPSYNLSLQYSVSFFGIRDDDIYFNTKDSVTNLFDGINYSNIEFTANTASETDES